jgi:choline dehydrogenase-like flavoprotein
MTASTDFDAIIIGSGITGGWAAKELTEKGLKVLVIERGRNVEHGVDYKTETTPPWEMPARGDGDRDEWARDYPIQSSTGILNEYNQHFFVKDSEHPYQTPEGQPFTWIRGYQLGGRSLVWGRLSFRMSDLDFAANATDGHGVDWPIRYQDLAPWYSHVEQFIGVNGTREGLAHLPDGDYQPPMALSRMEQQFVRSVEDRFPDRRVICSRSANLTEEREGRSKCQYRGICSRGCSYGAYFSTQSSTLPAAQATNLVTVITDTQVVRIVQDPETGRAVGVNAIDLKSRKPVTYSAGLVFLCAGAFNSVGLLLNSASAKAPAGIGNGTDRVGRGIMDHCKGTTIASLAGLENSTTFGNKPSMVYIPRFRNLADGQSKFVRGYGYNCLFGRQGWKRGIAGDKSGAELKEELRHPGSWAMVMVHYGECLPNPDNRITLDAQHKDGFGQPQLKIDFRWSANELAMFEDAKLQAAEMVAAAGGKVLKSSDAPMPGGSSVHEMGGAAMGLDPATSVTNRWNQVHDVPNLFITDGSVMASSACQNPSLTYMAMTARAAKTAVDMKKEGKI